MKRDILPIVVCAAGVLFASHANGQETAIQPSALALPWDRQPQSAPDPLARRPGESDEAFYDRMRALSRENATLPERFGDAVDDATEVVSGLFRGDYCDCIFDKMPSVNNDVAAGAVSRECSKRGTFCESKSGSWFGPSSPADCIEKYGKETGSTRAAKAISRACRQAYR